jgi:DNA (cytosine-5)-methyltransferase 1
MKILNLYAGLGGNRTLWEGHEVDAVEINPDICKIYKDRFPDDNVICADAHEYLLKNYDKYDFIWSSPPCPTHSSFRQNICVRFRGTEAVYPDMKLYQEIIFLKHNAKCKWVIENVKPYYDYLIKPDVVLQRHPFWSNFKIEKKEFEQDKIRTAQIPDLQKLHGIDLSNYKVKDKRKLLRNCVYKDIGRYILEKSIEEVVE